VFSLVAVVSSPSPPRREERAGERRLIAKLNSDSPLPDPPPLVPRGERENFAEYAKHVP